MVAKAQFTSDHDRKLGGAVLATSGAGIAPLHHVGERFHGCFLGALKSLSPLLALGARAQDTDAVGKIIGRLGEQNELFFGEGIGLRLS